MHTLLENRLIQFAEALIDQKRAHVIVAPKENSSGFWFGGGTMIAGDDGTIYVSGRYRNFGDSREGLSKGDRGLELAVFRSADRGKTFQKILSFSKEDLSYAAKVYSIEGSALHRAENGKVELYISTEKAIEYPEEVRKFLKPGTGVWSIDRMAADRVENLSPSTLEPVLASEDPVNLHVKDPFIHTDSDGNTRLYFCTHPFSWSSSNTGYAVKPRGSDSFGPMVHNIIPKGQTWDVSMARGTSFLRLEDIGMFRNHPPITLVFYDSAECLRNHEEHKSAIHRPRGYSCEELGGCGYYETPDLTGFKRLSLLFPMFVSPQGTGCSRYVDVLETEEGFYATWQQSQADYSQPLVLNFLSRQEAEELLG